VLIVCLWGPPFSPYWCNFTRSNPAYFDRKHKSGSFNQLNQIILITVLLFWTKVQNWFLPTSTCFIKKIYAPSSSLLQGKHLPFSPSPLRLNILRYLWSFRWPNYIVTLPRYFSFRLPHLNIPTGPPSDKLDKNSQRTWLIKNLSQWNGYSHFRFALDFSYAFGIL
jgi:hypothetical protein